MRAEQEAEAAVKGPRKRGAGPFLPLPTPSGFEPTEPLEREPLEREPLEADGSALGEAAPCDALLDEPTSAGRGSSSGGSREVISRKELGRQLRRQAYQRAKAARAADPKHLALKEVVKQRRRELYQRVKEQRKAREGEREAERKGAQAQERAEAKRQLAERVKNALAPASQSGGALACDIERALQNADVKALIEQLRAQSATLAAQHRDSAPVAALSGEEESG